MIRNGRRTVWSDAAQVLSARAGDLKDRIAVEATVIDYDPPRALEALRRMGAEWIGTVQRCNALYEAQWTVDARAEAEDPNAPAARRARGLEPIRPAPRRSRVTELVDAAYGMAPAPDTADVPF